jgi:murein DD-endopeptidase MepM/ murein hydrolase activator NlpD
MLNFRKFTLFIFIFVIVLNHQASAQETAQMLLFPQSFAKAIEENGGDSKADQIKFLKEFVDDHDDLSEREVERVTYKETDLVGDSSKIEKSYFFFLGGSDEVVKVDLDGDEFELSREDLRYTKTVRNYEVIVEETIYDSIKLSLGSEELALHVDRAYSEDFMTARGLRAEASLFLELIEYSTDNLTMFGEVLNAKLIVGRALIEKVLTIDPQNGHRTLKTKIPSPEERVLTNPVNTEKVSSLFNLTRKHPLKRRIIPHNGVDFRAQSGTPIYPAMEGVISAIGRSRSKGKYIYIEHPNGFVTSYNHLRRFKKGMKVGKKVELSDQIGEVGRTGYATGAHLHFALIIGEYFVNPLHYFKSYQVEDQPIEIEEPLSEE